MLNYLKKFAMDILPSVAATIIGAYIVNHYVTTKPAADAPAAAVSTAQPKKAEPAAIAKAAEAPAEIANIPEPGIKAKGISEKAMIEKTAAEKPAEVKPTEVRPTEPKSAEVKPAEVKATDTANRRLVAPREKSIAKSSPGSAPGQAPASVAIAPAVVAPVAAPAAEAAAAPTEDHRDAAELARAAIERLRGNSDSASRAAEPTRPAETSRVQEMPRTVAPAPARPLPPPIMVSTPSVEAPNTAAMPSGTSPPNTGSIANSDPNRPTPPADIPLPQAASPFDPGAAAPPRDHAKTVAEDVLAAAKSMFHAVLPQ